MSARKEYHPEKVRSQLSHPIIDGDGHWIEYGPVFVEQVRKAAGDKAADGLPGIYAAFPTHFRSPSPNAAAAASPWKAIGGASPPTPATGPQR